jgi:hypothetical protein
MRTLLDPADWDTPRWRALSRELYALGPETKRRLAREVSKRVIENVLNGSPDAAELLDSHTSEERLHEIEEAHDVEGWDAQDAGNEEEYDASFRKARAASTAIRARYDNADEALAETLYEARYALEDDDALYALTSELTSPS